MGPSAFSRRARQQEGFKILRYSDLLESPFYTGNLASRLAGLQQAFTMYLAGKASFHSGETGFEITQTGNAPQYLRTEPNNTQCSYVYTNPMNPSDGAVVQSVVAAINQIIFAIATDVSQLDEADYTLDSNYGRQNFTAVRYKDEIHYITHHGYMWGGVASMILCVLCVLPVYWGYWRLGRKVSLGPFEIAHAFHSPMTAGAPNGTVDDLMKEVGGRKVKYGQIVAGDASGVLGIAEPEYVARVHPGIGSAQAEIREKFHEAFGRAATH